MPTFNINDNPAKDNQGQGISKWLYLISALVIVAIIASIKTQYSDMEEYQKQNVAVRMGQITLEYLIFSVMMIIPLLISTIKKIRSGEWMSLKSTWVIAWILYGSIECVVIYGSIIHHLE